MTESSPGERQEQTPEEIRRVLEGVAEHNRSIERFEDMTKVAVVVDGKEPTEVIPLGVDDTHLELDWDGMVFSVELNRISSVT